MSSDDTLADYNDTDNVYISNDKTTGKNDDKAVKVGNERPTNPFHGVPKRSEHRESDKAKAEDTSHSASKMRKNDTKTTARSSNSARTGWNDVAGPDTNDHDTRNTSWVTPGHTDQNDTAGGWDNGNGVGGDNGGEGLEQMSFW